MRFLSLKTFLSLFFLLTLHSFAMAQSSTNQPNGIDEDLFWKVINSTIANEGNPEQQLISLQLALSKLSVDDVGKYERTFDHEMRRSYAWNLWGADYVIHGGASDDSFEYFRCWIISKGKSFFEHVLADPDTIADLVETKPGDVLEFEQFAYVARKVWAQKTGNKSNAMPGAAPMMYIGQKPIGIEFDDSPVALAKKYPKLWKRFGEHPLE